jgi:hypothetical protein
MSTFANRDRDHIFESLRKGLVPERGIDAFAVGIEKQRGELHRQLELAAAGEGSIKFLRGGYGCGKTLVARVALLDAQAQGFATSFVVVSENDLKFHRFDEVYRKILAELSTSVCPRGALGDILDRWIGRVEGALIDGGEDETAADFDAKVRARLDADLASSTRGQAPPDFVRVVQTIFDLKQQGELVEAGALLSWLSGSSNVAAAAKKRAGIKGEIDSGQALAYLRGVLEIVKAAGYKGLVVVIDEAETILRMRKDTRHSSLNGVRQLADAAPSYHGLLWLMTGTPEFFDSQRGVAGLAPLHDRVRFLKQGRFASLRQAQLELSPFDQERLRAVALKLRELFPTADRARIDTLVSLAFIDRLVAEVTHGFKGDVGVVPRQFLRELVTIFDLVDQEAEYDPTRDYGFTLPPNLSPEEQRAAAGQAEGAAPLGDEDDDDALVPAEDAW